MILGLLNLYQTDFNNKWFASAKELADELIARFRDPEGGFFDTPEDAEHLLIRPKDMQDNATLSGNSMACEALRKLAEFSGEGNYRDIAEKSLTLITGFVLRYPLGFTNWLSTVQNSLGSIKQVALLGEAHEKNFQRMPHLLRAEYRPDVTTAASFHPIKDGSPALLDGRTMIQNKATVYVCEGFACRQPTIEIQTLIEQLKS